MPKKEIELIHRVQRLSILDAEGNLDEELEPDIDHALLIKLHRFMLLSRRFDERMLSLQRQGRIGTFGPIKGQEAAHLGAVAALEEKDWFVPSFREMGAEIWRGKELVNILLAYGGFNEGGAMREGSTNLPLAIPVGTQIPHAVGIGYALKYRQQDRVVMVFFGDGATSEGDFHEALNFAGVFKTPVVFVCQNNHWAISVPRSFKPDSLPFCYLCRAPNKPDPVPLPRKLWRMVLAAFRWMETTFWPFMQRPKRPSIARVAEMVRH